MHTGQIELLGINPYVLVDRDVANQLAPGRRRPIPVVLTIEGATGGPWEISLMPKGDGTFYLYLSKHIRDDVNAQVGDTIDYALKFDHSYKGGPQHPLPADLQAALKKSAAATRHWEALSASLKKEILRYLAGLKSEAAREKNLHRLSIVLGGKPGRYLGREWKDGKISV